MNVYDYQYPLGKILDAPDLKAEFITVYDSVSHKDAARFAVSYGRRLIALMGDGITPEALKTAEKAFNAIAEWLEGKTWYQKARSVGGEFNDLARGEKDPVKARFYRTMAQTACVPHVKYHALWACDFAVTLINRLYPNDADAVRKERSEQIKLIKAQIYFF